MTTAELDPNYMTDYNFLMLRKLYTQLPNLKMSLYIDKNKKFSFKEKRIIAQLFKNIQNEIPFITKNHFYQINDANVDRYTKNTRQYLIMVIPPKEFLMFEGTGKVQAMYRAFIKAEGDCEAFLPGVSPTLYCFSQELNKAFDAAFNKYLDQYKPYMINYLLSDLMKECCLEAPGTLEENVRDACIFIDRFQIQTLPPKDSGVDLKSDFIKVMSGEDVFYEDPTNDQLDNEISSGF